MEALLSVKLKTDNLSKQQRLALKKEQTALLSLSNRKPMATKWRKLLKQCLLLLQQDRFFCFETIFSHFSKIIFLVQVKQ